MCKSARRDRWDHTANLLALLINVNRDPKKTSPVTAESVHPFERDAEQSLTRAERQEVLKDQMATLKERAFQGKVRRMAPFDGKSRNKA